MNPVVDSQFLSSLVDSNIAIDTCCLIDSIKHEDLVGKFLFDLKTRGVGFYTTQGVVFEYLRGSSDETALKRRLAVLSVITDNFIVPIDKKFTEMTAFLLVMNKVLGRCGLGEYQLIATLIDHPKSYLLTENHKDIPIDFIDRSSVVCFNMPNGEIKTYGFYKINEDKYEKIAKSILQ